MIRNEDYVMPDGQKYLPEDYSLPCGVIEKTHTGLGATTNEINNPSRNSIIVVPTRSLAATKAIKEGVLYGGGKYEGIASTNIMEIKAKISDKTAGKKKVKIICVVDTFIRWYQEDPLFFKRKFFLLIDEADTLQSESGYREVMETLIEIYFDFPLRRRAMISATIQESLHPKFKHENVTRIINNAVPPKIRLVRFKGDIRSFLINIIKNHKWKKRNTKLLIAFNSIDQILDVIYVLENEYGDKYKDKFQILCSDKSAWKVGSYFGVLNADGILQKQITFMTSAYFAGVDINERIQVYAISDATHQHTTLTKGKIVQIFGRAREGFTAGFFVTNLIKKKIDNLDKPSLLKEAWQAKKLIEAIGTRIKDEEEFKKAVEKIGVIKKNNVIRMVRNTPVINYMILDNIIQENESLRNIHTDFKLAENYLSDRFEILSTATVVTALDDKQSKLIKMRNEAQKQDISIKLINLFRFPYSLDLEDLPPVKTEVHKLIERFYYYRLTELFKKDDPILRERLADWMTTLAERNSLTAPKLRVALKSLILQKVFEDEERNKELNAQFPPGSLFTKDQIFRKMSFLLENCSNETLKMMVAENEVLKDFEKKTMENFKILFKFKLQDAVYKRFKIIYRKKSEDIYSIYDYLK